MVIKKSPGGESAGGGRVVNFEIHLCSSGVISDCIWRSISIHYVQIEAGVNSDLGKGSFWVELSIQYVQIEAGMNSALR